MTAARGLLTWFLGYDKSWVLCSNAQGRRKGQRLLACEGLGLPVAVDIVEVGCSAGREGQVAAQLRVNCLRIECRGV